MVLHFCSIKVKNHFFIGKSLPVGWTPWISPEKSSKRTDVKNSTTQNPTFPFASKTRYLLKSKTQHNPHSLGSHCVSASIFTVTRRTTEECCSSLSEVNSVFFCTFSSLPCTAENSVRSPLSCPAPLCSWWTGRRLQSDDRDFGNRS